MRIVVTGRQGQVVTALRATVANRGGTFIGLGRPSFDLAASPASIIEGISAQRPDAIVSAAAYTAVDKAEGESDLAFMVNRDGPAAVAQAAALLAVPLIHLSTDYVFDGRKAEPYGEDDLTGPTGVYGASKLAGEHAVLEAHGNSIVLRTAWVYSEFGANFMRTMLRLAEDRDEIGVVADQFGNPTSAHDIASGIMDILENLVASSDAALRGIFHMAGTGSASWAEFAEAIFLASRSRGGPSAAVRPISTAAYPTPARRPANSQLNCDKLSQFHNVRLPEWHRSVPELVARALSTAQTSK